MIWDVPVMFIRDQDFFSSRILVKKKLPIPDPDPQRCAVICFSS
jgi:hypothetical protein